MMSCNLFAGHDKLLAPSFMAVLVTMVTCSSVTSAGVEFMLDGVGKTGAAGFSVWVPDVESLPQAPSTCNSV